MHFLERAWYQKAGWLVILWPVAKLFQLLALIRKQFHSSKSQASNTSAPVIVVGNITVGGTGKTPLIIKLGKALQELGLKPGVISRGYLGQAPAYPFVVDQNSDVAEAGDEALLVVRALNCPMVIDPNRPRALEKINNDFQCDVVLSDDGMQHYALPRDLEVAVIDGERLFGNGMCLPAGPLREPISRLDNMKYVVVNGDTNQDSTLPVLQRAAVMTLEPTFLINLLSKEKKPFRGAPFNIGTTIHAVSGIGNPSRFYESLGKLPYKLEQHDFPDHHPFTKQDFDGLGVDDHQPIIMTEKDAVKCKEFAKPNFWYLSANTKLPEDFLNKLVAEIKQLCAERKN
jgi:tetraacyldisaccharide 4'-kinase